VINDKSQGSVAAHLRCGGLFNYKFTVYLSRNLAVKKIEIGEHLTKWQAKKADCLACLASL